MKKIMSSFRLFLLAPFMIYIFNLMAVGLDIYIPINFISIFIVGVLGVCGFIMLIVFYLFIF